MVDLMNEQIVNIINSMNEDVIEYKNGVYYIGNIYDANRADFIVEQFNRILYNEGIDGICYLTKIDEYYNVYIEEKI